VWYAGAVESVSPNLGGELADAAAQRLGGKGWLLADLEQGSVTAMPVPAARPILDLEPVRAEGLSAAALDAQIAMRLAAVPGGIADKIVRLRVYDIPRHVGRELNHAAIRAYRAEALPFHLDLRRPEIHRAVGVGSPGRRQTLPEIVRSYLERRPLPAELDRAAFVQLGESLMDSVERELAGG
jgi:exonuclease SbcD